MIGSICQKFFIWTLMGFNHSLRVSSLDSESQMMQIERSWKHLSVIFLHFNVKLSDPCLEPACHVEKMVFQK